MRLTTIVLFLTIALSACAEPLEFADWTVSVPEGTRTVEYAHVPLEDRTEHIALVEDLVIGGDPDEQAEFFYRPYGAAVDEEGNAYVLDAGNHRIQVFDSEGRYLRTIGRQGQGPGEMEEPHSITIAGRSLVVADSGTTRLSYWSLDGTYRQGVPHNRGASLFGLADGSMVVRYMELDRDRPITGPPPFRQAFVHLSEEGVEAERYAALPAIVETSLAMVLSDPWVAVFPDGDVYVTPGHQYQVLALDSSGAARWALRTNWPTPPIPQWVFDEAIERGRQRNPEFDPSLQNWPDNVPAIARVEVDGHGHLYVYPYVLLTYDTRDGGLIDPPENVPVDVYSRDGEMLFAGVIPFEGRAYVRWDAVHGDYVYTRGPHPETGETAVFRHRLVEPFD